MDLLIVTGLSGAGKSQVSIALEDIGYYCIDNMPPSLIPNFAELSTRWEDEFKSIALVMDVRSKRMFNELTSSIDKVKEQGYSVKILFMECSSEVLIRRYKETRRRHPLISTEIISVEDAIDAERVLLEDMRQQADYLIDTSMLSAMELKERIRNQFSQKATSDMTATVVSFGFKYGIPKDPDLMFDVRCLKNPFYVKELKEKTGLDKLVEDFVMSFEDAKVLINKLEDMLDFLIPLYIKEGKSNLVVAFGCTGGKHRSIVFAKKIAAYLISKGITVNEIHRDINRH